MRDQITKLSRLLNRPLTLLQCGAADGYGVNGILLDLKALQASGVEMISTLMEPVSAYFDALVENVKLADLTDVQTMQYAAGKEGGERKLNFIKPELSALAPEWCQTLSATEATLFLLPELPTGSVATELVQVKSLAALMGFIPDVLLLDWHFDDLPDIWTWHKPMVVRVMARLEDHAEATRYFQRAGYRVTVLDLALICWLQPKRSRQRELQPCYLHHVWLGDNEMPADQAAWVDGAADMLPCRTQKIWDEQELEAQLPDLMAPDLVLRRDVPVGMRADVARYNLLRLHGGLYLDTDFQVLRSFEHLLIPGCLHYAEEIPGRPAIGFLHTSKGHPFWDFLLVRMAALLPRKPENHWDIIQLTGPEAFARALGQWVTHLRKVTIYDEHGPVRTHWPDAHVVAFHSRAFYPYYYGPAEKARYDAAVAAAGGDVAAAFPGAYAVHHWAAGWVEKKPLTNVTG